MKTSIPVPSLAATKTYTAAWLEKTTQVYPVTWVQDCLYQLGARTVRGLPPSRRLAFLYRLYDV